MTPGHFRLPCSAPPRPCRALPHWFFVSGKCGPKQRGDPSVQTKQWPSGTAADWSLFAWRFKPRQGEFYTAAAAAKN